jgi:SAM-dependent methyltransferase
LRDAAYPTYVGIEPDASSRGVAQDRLAALGTGRTVLASLQDLPPDDMFDLICSFEVIEHIADDSAALAEWTEKLAPGGTLILSTPADERRYGAADRLVGHYRRYEPAGFAAILQGAGLEAVSVTRYGGAAGVVLEQARNIVASRKLSQREGLSPEERSSGSGRHLQPSGPLLAYATWASSAPFRGLDAIRPGHGTGLIAFARKPR